MASMVTELMTPLMPGAGPPPTTSASLPPFAFVMRTPQLIVRPNAQKGIWNLPLGHLSALSYEMQGSGHLFGAMPSESRMESTGAVNAGGALLEQHPERRMDVSAGLILFRESVRKRDRTPRCVSYSLILAT